MNVFARLQQRFSNPTDGQTLTLQQSREQIFSALVTVAALAGTVAIVLNAISQVREKNWLFLGITVVAYLWILTIALFQQIPYTIRAASSILLLYILGLSTGVLATTVGGSRVWLITSAVLATVFLGGRAGIFMGGVNLLTWLMLGILFQQGLLEYNAVYLESLIQPGNLSLWIATGGSALVTGLTMVVSVAMLFNSLNNALEHSRSLTEDLEQKSAELLEQTQTLTRQSEALKASAHIGRTLTSVLETDLLLHQAAQLIQTEFKLHHVAIFLSETENDEITLRASSGSAEEHNLPATGFQLASGQGLVRRVITEARLLASTGTTEATLPALEIQLPETLAYAALPLRARGEVLGALSVQSETPQRFDADMLTTLQILADQVATLLDNSRLFAERQASLESERRAYRALTRDAWVEFIQRSQPTGIRRDQSGIQVIKAAPQRTSADTTVTTHSIPIKIRDEIVGYLDAQKPETAGGWSTTEIDMLNTLGDRLAAALDSARLYEETQKKAMQEELVGAATTRMRETLDIETVLRTAAQELRAALDLAEVEVQMKTSATSADE